MTSLKSGLALLVASVCAPTIALAGESTAVSEPAVRTATAERLAASPARVATSGDLVVRANPMGAILFAALAYRIPYRFDAKRNVDSATLQFGLGTAVNGAFVQGGPFIEWMPFLPVQLRAQYDVLGFSGSHGSLLSFPSANAPFGDDVVSARAGSEERTTAHRLLLRPVLRAKLGRVVLRNQTELAHYWMNGRGPYFFEREYDTLLAASDDLVSSRTGLMFLLRPGRTAPGLALGPAYEITYARSASLVRQRVGLQGSFIPDADPGSFFAGFRVYGMAGINLEDRNRNHEPFVMLGVGTDINL